MRKIHIAADQFTTEEEVHDLDALYDLLSELTEKTQIIISGEIADEANLGEYGERLLTVLEEAAQDNAELKLKITE